ncbi:nucleotidyltransferase domain-containing protein [Nonomuraea wenchangensis]
MTPQDARAVVADLPAARERWLAHTIATVQAQALWLAGSLGRGGGDAWSDVDLIVVGGHPVLDDALFILEQPSNGPAGGGYVGALYDIGPLTLWVDWYLWPPGVEVPGDTRLLLGQGTSGDLSLGEALDRIGRGCHAPPPDPELFALAMLPLAAKFIARRQSGSAVAMATMLGAPPDLDPLDSLTAVLARIIGHATVRERVEQYLQVVKTLVCS